MCRTRRKQVKMAKFFRRFSLEGQVQVSSTSLPRYAMRLRGFMPFREVSTVTRCYKIYKSKSCFGQGFLRDQRRHLCYSGSSFPRTILSRPIAKLTGCRPTCRDWQFRAISILVHPFLHHIWLHQFKDLRRGNRWRSARDGATRWFLGHCCFWFPARICRNPCRETQMISDDDSYMLLTCLKFKVVWPINCMTACTTRRVRHWGQVWLWRHQSVCLIGSTV